jgi:hypothetical protein
MSIIPALLSDVTFTEVCLSLVVLGVIERIMVRLPEEMVGPGGWLLDTGTPR